MICFIVLIPSRRIPISEIFSVLYVIELYNVHDAMDADKLELKDYNLTSNPIIDC